MRALVTGAAGFLGRSVVQALLGRSVAVRAMVRPSSGVETLGWGPEVEVVRADLRVSRDLEATFAGVDVLVHLAVAGGGGEDAQFATTVVGTERLLAAMGRSGCRRLVLASSFAVYDWSAIDDVLDEDSPIEPVPELYQRDGYSIAKSWQERIVRRAAAEHGWALTVLRPGFIWGPERAYLAAMGLQVSKVHLVVSPLARMPMTHVENCADLFALAVVDPRAGGETFNVVDGPGERIWTFLGEYLRRTGMSGWRIPVPYAAAFLGVRVAFATVFRRNLKLPQILIPCRFESRLKPLRYTNEKARRQLGWTPPLDLRQCLQRTFAPVSG
ncbi:MAG TPA: NAD(P)-dependent oxidoreductase [Myxococcaceae bacterium]|jgi:UDP-glucose 4-epimerase